MATFVVVLCVSLVLIAVLPTLVRELTRPAPPSPPPGAQPLPEPKLLAGRPVDGVQCGSQESAYHVHAYLGITYRGTFQIVPANVGILARCFYWLHTHDDSGFIHVEAPRTISPRLGTFFDIWGQPLSRSRVASRVVDPDQRLRVLVDGRIYTGDPRGIVLKNHEVIRLEIGPPFARNRSVDFAPVD